MTFHRSSSRGKQTSGKETDDGANSTQQSHAVGTNPDNRSKCVLMNVSVDPSL
jgi:hypothetical protein